MSTLKADELAEALKRCETEAIHLIGRVQPHGCMVIIGPAPDWRVLQVSANLPDFFPVTPEAALGTPLKSLIGEEQAAELAQLLLDASSPQALSHLVYSVIGERVLELQTGIHRTQGLICLEFEPIRRPYQARDLLELFNPVRKGIGELDAAATAEKCCQVAAELVRSLTAFDRVMVYRFDQNWEGEVVAESRSESAASYLGNRFPAGDIPPQARQLYTRNLLRLVCDVDAEPSPLFPAENPLLGCVPDLSMAVLRAFSPVHVEYLRNMGVGASLSISILLDDRLWGLIACHHEKPAFVTHPVREMLEFAGKLISMKLAGLEARKKLVRSHFLGQVMTALVSDLYSADIPSLAILKHREAILGLVDASGALVVVDGERYPVGRIPSERQVDDLLEWLSRRTEAKSFATDHLAAAYEPAAAFSDNAAGLLATPIGPSMRSAVLWFRPEKPRTVNWAGAPEKRLAEDAQGELRISPRKSFAVWTETWRQRSDPWMPEEVQAGETLADVLLESLTQRSLRQREEFYRLFGDQAPELIARLDEGGRFVFVSANSRLILGYSQEALLGSRFADLVQEADRVDFQHHLDHASHTQPATVVFRVQSDSRPEIWLESTIKRVPQPDGAFQTVIIARDVSERQNFQLAIEEFQRINLGLLEMRDQAILAIDCEGRVSFANESACELLGWPADELLGRHAHDTVHHSHADGSPYRAIDCPTTMALGQGIAALCRDDCYFHRDGSPIRVFTAATPIINDGAVTGVLVVFLQACREEAVNPLTCPDGVGAIMTLDREGRITCFSDAMARLTGYSLEEALGQMPSLLRSNVHTRSFFRDMWRRLAEEKSWRGIVWNRCKDGAVRPFWVNMSAICDRAGEIEQYLAIYGEASARSSPEAQLHFLASHDSLTGLPNRTLFGRRLKQALARAGRLGKRVVLAFIDLDHFKAVNDDLGHGWGDRYLIEIVRRLRESSREEDTLARWGGDEFLLLMEDVQEPQFAVLSAARLLAAISRPLVFAHREMIPSASIGIAVYPDDAGCATSLIEAADAAMYRAKRDGRGRVAT